MNPIHIPDDWDDSALLTFEEFCDLIHTAHGTVRDWRRRRVGPRWVRFESCGRIYMLVGEARRFVASATSKAPARAER